VQSYTIPIINSMTLLQRQLNAAFGALAQVAAAATALLVTDEMFAPLQTEDGSVLEIDP